MHKVNKINGLHKIALKAKKLILFEASDVRANE